MSTFRDSVVRAKPEYFIKKFRENVDVCSNAEVSGCQHCSLGKHM